MLTAPKKSISETFLIWNEGINFVGGLISSPEGSAKICGRVVFKNDSEVLFSSQTGDRRVLHQKLVSTCQFIARFYGADIYYRRIRMTCQENDLYSFSGKEGALMN